MVKKSESLKKCLVHYSSISQREQLAPFRPRSFDKFLQCRTDWLELPDFGRENVSIAKTSFELCPEGEVFFQKFHFHKRCYQKFTNYLEIDRARKRKTKLAAGAVAPSRLPLEICRGDRSPPKKVKRPVKKAALCCFSDRNEEFVLSEMCIICAKAKRYKTNPITLTRMAEKLARAQTPDAGCLRKAAEKAQHECILREIRGKDCVAIGVRYHRSCYASYINILQKKTEPTTKLYEKSYKVFCKNVIEDKILQKRRVFFSTGLFKIFVNIVSSVELLDASSYRTERLKHRLLADFPHLVFHKPRRKNRSEIVYSKYVETEEVSKQQPTLPTQPEASDTPRQ